MKLSKEFQLYILHVLADVYPQSALQVFNYLAEKAPVTAEQQVNYVIIHAKLLSDMGYIENLHVELGIYGVHKYNTDFRITTKGLLAIGVDILNPNPNQQLVNQLLTLAVKKYQVPEQKTGLLQSTLATLPQKTLEKLLEKGLDGLIALIFS